MNAAAIKTAALLLLLGAALPAGAETLRKVDFYGVISPDADEGTVSMTDDLFYKQLEDRRLAVSDRRGADFSRQYMETGSPDFSDSDPEAYAFFVYIRKDADADGQWSCSVNVRDPQSGKTSAYSRSYDSYYKILMEAKAAVAGAFAGLAAGGTDTSGRPAEKEAPAFAAGSTETVAGTWSGEQNIDKIVILRGGRGFIIFSNGASMTITVAVSQDESGSVRVQARQTGRSNASFFPELPRKVALESAIHANPVEWNLVLTSADRLEGTKTTLLQPESGGLPEEGQIDVSWTRRN